MISNKKKLLPTLIALFSIVFAMGSAAAINTVLAMLAEKFSTVNLTTVYMLSTAPSLVTLVVTLLFGPLIGKKIRYKTTFLIALVFYTIAGIAPFFYMENFYFLLGCRLVFGIGQGLITFYSAAFLYIFGAEKGSRYVALATTLAGVSAIIFQNLAAQLSKVSLNAVFLIYAVGIVAFLLLLFFFDEPKTQETEESTVLKNEAQGSENKAQNRMSPVVYGYVAILAICVLLTYPAALSVSALVEVKGIGGASLAGILASCFTLGPLVSGPFFGQLNSFFKRYMGAFVFGLFAISNGMIYLSNSPVIIGIGFFLCGFANTLFVPLLYLYCGSVTTPENTAKMSAYIMAFSNLAAFGCTYWLNLCGKLFGDVVLSPIKVCAVVTAVACVIAIFVDLRPNVLKIKKEKTND